MTADTRPGKEDGAGDGHLDSSGSTASPLLLERRGPHPVPDTIRISPEQKKRADSPILNSCNSHSSYRSSPCLTPLADRRFDFASSMYHTQRPFDSEFFRQQ